jgi:hypothetical protein
MSPLGLSAPCGRSPKAMSREVWCWQRADQLDLRKMSLRNRMHCNGPLHDVGTEQASRPGTEIGVWFRKAVRLSEMRHYGEKCSTEPFGRPVAQRKDHATPECQSKTQLLQKQPNLQLQNWLRQTSFDLSQANLPCDGSAVRKVILPRSSVAKSPLRSSTRLIAQGTSVRTAGRAR